MIKVLITPPLFLLPLLCFGFCTGGKPALPIISAKHYKNPVPIIVERDSLTLIWSRPDTNYNLIDYYELFYRNDTVSDWVGIEMDVPAVDSPKVTLSRSQFTGNSQIFYFAVRSANKTGAISDYHKSTDGDWFILWNPK
jgi:hypothetical protein